RDRAEQVAHAVDEQLAAVAGGLLLGRLLVLAGAYLGEGRRESRRLPGAPARGAEELPDVIVRLGERVIGAHPGGRPDEVGGGREGELALHGRALDRQDAEGLGQLGEERRDERALADAHLTGDDARDEV